MPLEIRELIIRTQIVSHEKRDYDFESKRTKNIDSKIMVEQCVKKVLKALKKKMDR